MKKIILSAILIGGISAAYCQQFTLKIGGGYGWSTGNSTIKGFQPMLSNSPADVNNVLDPANATILDLANSSVYGSINPITNQYLGDTAGSRSLIHGSYGKGGNFSVELGYKINPYIAVALGFNYAFSDKISASQLYGNNLSQTLGNNTTVTTSTYSYGLSMAPNVTVYAAPKDWKLKPYVRVGLNIPMFGNLVDNIHINSPSALLNTTKLTSDLRVETQGKFSLGYGGAIGLQYAPIPLIGIWAEVNVTSLNVSGKTSTLTEYVVDGTDLTTGKQTHANRLDGTGSLPSLITLLGGNNNALTTYSKVTEYQTTISSSSNTTDYGNKRDQTGAHNGQAGYVDESKAHQVTQITAPFSNIGVNIGITICMSKKIFQDPTGKKAAAAAAAK